MLPGITHGALRVAAILLTGLAITNALVPFIVRDRSRLEEVDVSWMLCTVVFALAGLTCAVLSYGFSN